MELVPDCQGGNLGPLIGILSGLIWAKKQLRMVDGFSC